MSKRLGRTSLAVLLASLAAGMTFCGMHGLSPMTMSVPLVPLLLLLLLLLVLLLQPTLLLLLPHLLPLPPSCNSPCVCQPLVAEFNTSAFEFVVPPFKGSPASSSY